MEGKKGNGSNNNGGKTIPPIIQRAFKNMSISPAEQAASEKTGPSSHVRPSSQARPSSQQGPPYPGAKPGNYDAYKQAMNQYLVSYLSVVALDIWTHMSAGSFPSCQLLLPPTFPITC